MGKAITLTTKQLCAGFGISHVTAYNWRQGSATKSALPVIISTDESGREVSREVRFGLAETKAWARDHGLKFDQAKAMDAVAGKSGPKPVSKPAKATAAAVKPAGPSKAVVARVRKADAKRTFDQAKAIAGVEAKPKAAKPKKAKAT